MLVIPQDVIVEILNKVVDEFLVPKFYELNMNSSGKWLKSLAVEAENNVGVIKGQDYTKYLVQGRGPNSDQDPEALRAWAVYYGRTVIADWARAKGVTIDPIAIAYKIARDGTTWHQKGGSDLLEVLSTPEVKAFINRNLAEYANTAIKLQILKTLKNE